MEELTALQEFVSQALLHRRDLSRDPAFSPEAERLIDQSANFSGARRLEISREQFWFRHTGSLLEDFPGVAGILGQADWERLTEEYLSAHPPTSHSLRDLGSRLPEFTQSANFLEHRRLVSDMAWLEWFHVELFDAPEPTRLSAELLAGMDEEELGACRLVLSPALRLLRVDYPVTELRNRILRAGDTAVPVPASEPATLVIYRRDLAIWHHRLRRAPFALLEALSRRATLSEACGVACALGPDAAASVENEVGTWFADWVARGFVVGIERSSPAASTSHEEFTKVR